MVSLRWPTRRWGAPGTHQRNRAPVLAPRPPNKCQKHAQLAARLALQADSWRLQATWQGHGSQVTGARTRCDRCCALAALPDRIALLRKGVEAFVQIFATVERIDCW
jgi:hypothetical protein